jgi:hypothetical protein
MFGMEIPMLDDLREVMSPDRLWAGPMLRSRRRERRHWDALPAREWMVLARGDGSVEPIAKFGEFKAESTRQGVSRPLVNGGRRHRLRPLLLAGTGARSCKLT